MTFMNHRCVASKSEQLCVATAEVPSQCSSWLASADRQSSFMPEFGVPALRPRCEHPVATNQLTLVDLDDRMAIPSATIARLNILPIDDSEDDRAAYCDAVTGAGFLVQ